MYILIGIILLGLIMPILHYLVGHHIIRAIRRARKIINNEKVKETPKTENILLQTNNTNDEFINNIDQIIKP